MNLEDIKSFIKLAHKHQTRKGGREYYLHPVSVMNHIKECGINDENILATALLHDVIEDTLYDYEYILSISNKDVADAVLQLTNKQPIGTKFKVKQAALLEHAKHYNRIAKIVKVSDRYDNIRDSLKEWELWRCQRYANAGLDLLNTMEPIPEEILPLAQKCRELISEIMSMKDESKEKKIQNTI